MVDAVVPSFGTEVGDAITDDAEASTVGVVNWTVAVWVTVTVSVVSFAVYVTLSPVVSVTPNSTSSTGIGRGRCWAYHRAILRMRRELTVLPLTGRSLLRRSVTVMVDAFWPSAGT